MNKAGKIKPESKVGKKKVRVIEYFILKKNNSKHS